MRFSSDGSVFGVADECDYDSSVRFSALTQALSERPERPELAQPHSKSRIFFKGLRSKCDARMTLLKQMYYNRQVKLSGGGGNWGK